MRKKTRRVRVGNIFIGGNSPISIQSMTNTDTKDVKSTIEQISKLADAGCNIVRVAVPDFEAVNYLKDIKKACRIPLVADVHYSSKLAIECIKAGVDKIRINPGNIGGIEKMLKVASEADRYGIAMRIGINSGSVEKPLLSKYGGPTPEALVESALNSTERILETGYSNIVVSLKSSDVPDMVKAYRLFSQKSDIPLHVGVTESGTYYAGTIKSAIGIGSLLLDGIGDTIRVSLTGDPVEEIRAGVQILGAVGLSDFGISIISCPTCGRCRVNLPKIAEDVEAALSNCKKNLKVAIMGCEVNGPGEAKIADIGLAGGDNCMVLFIKGKPVRRVPKDKATEELLKEIEKL